MELINNNENITISTKAYVNMLISMQQIRDISAIVLAWADGIDLNENGENLCMDAEDAILAIAALVTKAGGKWDE